jgi:hypothetical protein
MATVGGDGELAAQARQLAEKWLVDRTAVSPDVAPSILSAAAYHGNVALYRKFLAELEKTEDGQDQQRLIAALVQFRDPAALEIGMQAVDFSLSVEEMPLSGAPRRGCRHSMQLWWCGRA